MFPADIMTEFDPALSIQAEQLASNLIFSPESRVRTSHTETMWKYRNYQGGEPAASIDWRMSAKGREIYVREHEKIIHKDIYFWASFLKAEEVRSHTLVVLLALAHILVRKERRIGWLLRDLPTTQTNSMIINLFSSALTSELDLAPSTNTHKIKNSLVIIASDINVQGNSLLYQAVRAYASHGNRGIILNLGEEHNRTTNDIAKIAYNSAWPVINLDRKDRADTTLTHLLEKTVQATR
jgi:uncharacterized protein (DUF58 family)